MTRDDVIRMAREAGLLIPSFRIDGGLALVACTVPDFERFASIIAAAEREACAKVCDAIAEDRWKLYKGRAPYTGREDGRANPQAHGESDGADLCAEAIRARGKS